MRPGLYDVRLTSPTRETLILRVRAESERQARTVARVRANLQHGAHAPWTPGIPVGPIMGTEDADAHEEDEGLDGPRPYFTPSCGARRAA